MADKNARETGHHRIHRMSSLKLALITLDRTERALTETVIELAGGLEIARWELVDEPGLADLVIVNIDSDAGSRQFQALSSQSDNTVPIVPLSTEAPDTRPELWLRRPITYANLVGLLKNAQRTQSGQVQPPVPADRQPEPASKAPAPAELDSRDTQPNDAISATEGEENADNEVFDDTANTEIPASIVPPEEEILPDEPTPETSQTFDTSTDQLIYSTTFSLTSLDVSTEPEIDTTTEEADNEDPGQPEESSTPTETGEQEPETRAHSATSETAKAPEDDTAPTPSRPKTDVPPDNVALALDEIIRPAKRFYPQMRLLGVLRRLVARNENCLVTHPRFPDIEIHPQSEWFYSPDLVEHTVELFHRPGSEFKVSPISHKSSPGESDELNRPLWVLTWLAALYGSEGRLLENINAHKPFKLRELPDTHMIPWPEEYRRIATYLYDYEANLSQVATVTQIPITTVIDFTNACREIGILEEAGDHTPPNEPVELEESTRQQPKPRQRGLMDKLRTRLRRLRPTR